MREVALLPQVDVQQMLEIACRAMAPKQIVQNIQNLQGLQSVDEVMKPKEELPRRLPAPHQWQLGNR